jgi:hypothetical protein
MEKWYSKGHFLPGNDPGSKQQFGAAANLTLGNIDQQLEHYGPENCEDHSRFFFFLCPSTV